MRKRTIIVTAVYDLDAPGLDGCKITPKERVKEMVAEDLAEYFEENEGFLNFSILVSDDVEEGDSLDDIMIRASRNVNLSSAQLINASKEDGLIGVYLLGMKNMLDYIGGANTKED